MPLFLLLFTLPLFHNILYSCLCINSHFFALFITRIIKFTDIKKSSINTPFVLSNGVRFYILYLTHIQETHNTWRDGGSMYQDPNKIESHEHIQLKYCKNSQKFYKEERKRKGVLSFLAEWKDAQCTI